MSYYDSGPYTREHWNKLIRDLNFLISQDCAGKNVEPLDEVDSNHVWTLGDVEEFREKLLEICEDNEFEEDLTKPWRTAIIDELADEMKRGWCGCTPLGPYLFHTAYPELSQVCLPEHDPLVPLSSFIDGMSVCGSRGRWTVYLRTYFFSLHGDPVRLATGFTNCEGLVEYSGSKMIHQARYQTYWCERRYGKSNAQFLVDLFNSFDFRTEYWLGVSACRSCE